MRGKVDPSNAWICTACSCTNLQACPGGCYWVAEDKCSSCFDDDGNAFATGAPEGGAFGIEHCPASEVPASHVPLFADETTCYCVRCKLRLAA